MTGSTSHWKLWGLAGLSECPGRLTENRQAHCGKDPDSPSRSLSPAAKDPEWGLLMPNGRAAGLAPTGSSHGCRLAWGMQLGTSHLLCAKNPARLIPRPAPAGTTDNPPHDIAAVYQHHLLRPCTLRHS